MLTLGPIVFAFPWALAGLGLVPALWLLLRLTPPTPLRRVFPPLRLLAGLDGGQQSAARPPWWLAVLRMVLALLLVLAAARPLLDAGQVLRGTGPVVLVIDDGWAAAADWTQRKAAARALLSEAERTERPVALLPTAKRETAAPSLRLKPAAEALEDLAALRPKPWGTDRLAALAPLAALPDGPPGHALWLADGLDAAAEGPAVWEALRKVGITGLLRADGGGPLVLAAPEVRGNDLVVTARRPRGGAALTVAARASAADGAPLAEVSLAFDDGARTAAAVLSLPSELRGRLARVELAEATSAAGVLLIDERWRRRPVGIVVSGGAGADTLLAGAHYVSRALEPVTEVRRGPLSELLDRELAMVVLVDPGPLPEAERDRLVAWMEAGGLVLRFAGPRLARGGGAVRDDPLLPVRLRFGGREMGGALSWRQPAALAPFPDDRPLSGLAVPADARVRRQVLAEPTPDLDAATWARLADGTPLVTAAARGKGRLVLVHTAADPEWSDLPLTGLFPQMLERILDMARGVETGAAAVPLPAIETLDGFGTPAPPPPGTRPLVDEGARPGPGQPPGLYGSGALRRAFNLAPGADDVAPLAAPPPVVERLGLARAPETDLVPPLLVAALVLALLDTLAGLALRGLLRKVALVASLALSVVSAQADDHRALEATRKTVLAYRLTGDAEVDRVSRVGLFGLGVMLNRRTAAEVGAPMGIDPERDELSFHPLLYWPLTGTAPTLSDAGAARVRAYLRDGGMILFDRREEGGAALGELAARLGIPPLQRLPGDHVLSRAYYLLDRFPGRMPGDGLWIEAAAERDNDGVPPVVAGDADWAGAWAVDDSLVPLFPVVPGGERQREMAFRFGINLVMVALTGNYKADQVHLPAIMERLGR